MTAQPTADLDTLLSRLRSGEPVDDATFDRLLYSPEARRRSSVFWTPVEVAQRVVSLLAATSDTRILDIGSGVGKFCIVGAMMSEALFVGIEQREHLVRMARVAALRAGLRNTRFVAGDFHLAEFTAFDVLYLFNPFEENAWAPNEWLDDSVALSLEKARDDIERAEALLGAARQGTRVVTYHGFGGDVPSSYERLVSERCHTGAIELWTKVQ